MTTFNGTCIMHGKTLFVFSDIASGWVCTECVKAGYFIDDINEEVTLKLEKHDD